MQIDSIREACTRAIKAELDITKYNIRMGDGDCSEAVERVQIHPVQTHVVADLPEVFRFAVSSCLRSRDMTVAKNTTNE